MPVSVHEMKAPQQTKKKLAFTEALLKLLRDKSDHAGLLGRRGDKMINYIAEQIRSDTGRRDSEAVRAAMNALADRGDLVKLYWLNSETGVRTKQLAGVMHPKYVGIREVHDALVSQGVYYNGQPVRRRRRQQEIYLVRNAS